MARLIKCRECGTAISRRAKVCPSCGAPARRTGCLTKFVIVPVFIVVAFAIFLAVSNPKGPATVSQVPTTQAVDDGPPRVGDRVIVERPGGAGHAHLSADEATVANLRSAIEAKTLGDFSRMRDAGLITIVPNGAEAVVLETGDGARRVRIESGDRSGSVGWVFREHLHANP